MPAPAWLRAWLACVLLLMASVAVAAPRIGVMTMQPGEVFFERFGHDAIIVQDPQSGQATSYNFGAFDPSEDDFIGNFVNGVMQYYLVALPLEQDLATYRDEGRGVKIQWLDLTPQQAQALADSLAEQARPENARYRYDYFTSNCSTKVRDAIDRALGGGLKSQLSGRSRGNTLRSEAVRLASPATWMWLGFDIGLGPSTDVPLSRWDEAYVPMRLADSLGESRNSAGQPLVSSEQVMLPHRIAPEPAEQSRSYKPWLLAGVLLAIALAVLGLRAPRLFAALMLPIWLLLGVLGLVLAFLWGFTEHWAAYRNQNLLLFNPLCLLLLPGAIALLRRRKPARWTVWTSYLVAACALVAWLPHWLAVSPQSNQIWVALLLPIQLAVAYVFKRIQARN
ncbi:DUF4105 domain-containing protein [Pseudoxanthomonas dokdonensis]|nr:DUF4105 domain-containing protein [Pseudoxanthomonas dokdonensis]